MTQQCEIEPKQVRIYLWLQGFGRISSHLQTVFSDDWICGLIFFQMALVQERAELRAKVIRARSIFYDFHVSLQKGDSYTGYAQITFQLLELPTELVIDFKGNEVTRLNQNGLEVPAKLVNGFLELDIANLRVGVNAVGVHYACGYNNDGSGCVSFVDVDSKQYIYTQFQPYYANRVFPCFDQPDLKAYMRLTVISPPEWKKVLSNQTASLEKEFEETAYTKATRTALAGELGSYLKGKEGWMTVFPETKLLPSYLFCFIAGEYLELKLEKEQQYKNIPMSVYCIQSLFQHMKNLAPFIFEITIESMRFFESFFNFPFSFNKYDQVFAHEYKWGAMENAGIVTFNDLYIFKEKVSTERLLSFANTISHELAHHWFGNLVTMKWWDDLWLNQSFADFISHFCLEKIKHNCKTIDYESAMASFLQRKGWGYHEDQMITTHPIRGKVENTSVADSIFDGITYSKGAATMKQLLYLMKEENFGKALSAYFTKYQWSNATIDDFLAEMQKHFTLTEFSLKQWRQLWLDKASLNLIEAEWNPEDRSPHAKIAIKQSPYTAEHPTLRLHKIKVGLFQETMDVDVIEALVLPQAVTVVDYDGSKGYKAILLNFEDHTFAKNVIDPVSLDFFIKNINSIKDILSRTLIWRSFFEMVKDAKMTSHKFVEVVTTALAKEPSDSIFERQFDFVNAAINSYTPEKYRDELNSSMFRFIYNLIPETQDQQNRLTILKGKLTSFAKNEDDKKTILKWKNGQDENLKGVEMTVGQKWSAVVKAFTLTTLSLEQKEAIFAAMEKEDPSDTAKKHRHTCNSLKSTEQQFEAIYQSFKSKESKDSVSVKESIAAGWNHEYHKDRLQKYKTRFFKDIQDLIGVLDGDHLEAFYENMEPIDDDLEFHIVELENIKFPGGKDKNARDILKKIDNLKRRLRAYNLYANPSL